MRLTDCITRKVEISKIVTLLPALLHIIKGLVLACISCLVFMGPDAVMANDQIVKTHNELNITYVTLAYE